MNCWGSNQQLFYGAGNDSVLIAYDDLRTVNSKLVELDYEKEINRKLRTVVSNDSIIINNLTVNKMQLHNSNIKLKKQRNVGFSIGIIGIITTILMILK